MPRKSLGKSAVISSTAKPNYTPQIIPIPGSTPIPPIDGNWIWAPLKAEWRICTPEEKVRQQFILVLNERYQYSFQQMDQERRTTHGHKSPKADIVVWATIEAKNLNQAPTIVVECKSDQVTIDPDDYEQGDSYARAIGDPCEFLVMHNNKETRFFRIIRGLPGAKEDIENIPSSTDLQDHDKMEAIRRSTKTFSREEFRRLLFDCHCILRDNHKMEPGKAFDEVSKILFIKMYIERTGNYDKFTTDYLDEYARIRRRNLEDVMNDLFDDTKMYYQADDLFGQDDHLNISFATFRRIVKLLERFNLGATSDDVKGIAFERFLGQTFRGELGQFFTPRPIVDFMVEFLDPTETDILCDPASGSGGFLIKHFEYVRNKVERDIHEQKLTLRASIEARHLSEEDEAKAISESFAPLNQDLDPLSTGSRLWILAHTCIYGCDAEPRAARTSKMNMIMHGDGHGGIHHHDGLVNTNGIFHGRFDVVLTNPPFGASVEADQIIGATPETQVAVTAELREKYQQDFGDLYNQSYAQMLQAEENKQTILSLYDVAKGSTKEKTEILFLERCLKLLKPGGCLGIVVPDGVLNNPSLNQFRDYIEDHARILAVVSIPDKTFRSSKTNVKASLLFLQRLKPHEETQRITAYQEALTSERAKIQSNLDELQNAIAVKWHEYDNYSKAKAPTKSRSRVSACLKLFGAGLDRAAYQEQRRKALRRISEINQFIYSSARLSMRKSLDHTIFMAVTEHVGIRASGKEDPANECWQPAKWDTF